MKRLLAVSWEMPPMYGPRATQVSRTMKALAVAGWRPTVVCMKPRRRGPHWRDGADAAELPGVQLLRVPSPEEWLVLRAARRLVPALRDIPDAQRVWVRPAARAAERAAASSEYAGLITFAQPWSDHLVGLRVHHRTALRWVAHFSDPWVDSPYATARGWRQSMAHRMEAEVVAEADAIVFVTDETADLVMRKYPAEWRRKVTIVPHGFESDAIAANAPTARRAGPMRIVHTGRFYSGVRTPVTVLQALAKAHARAPLTGALELIFIGPHIREFEREAAALGIASLVQFLDRMPPAEAATFASDADVLLVIDAPSSGPSAFLPSKLVDYLPFRKPILGVTPEVGASATLLRRLGCRVVPTDRVEAIACAFEELVHEWRSGRLAVSESFARIAAEYDIVRTSSQLSDVLHATFDA